MDIDAFVTNNDQTRVYECKYYYDPSQWEEASSKVKTSIQNLTWSDYIKYIDSEGNVSKELDVLPNDAGGLYLFFIQGTTIPFSEKYLAYIGRAKYTSTENIRKRVKRYLWESNQKQCRPKIARLFRLWKDYLYIRFCSCTDNDLITAGESTLINAILPPFNSDLPEKICFKEPQKAF